MTLTDFDLQMSRLVSCFGKNFYTDERKAIFFRKLGWVEADPFRRAVDHFIANAKTAPVLKDFEDYMREVIGPGRGKIIVDGYYKALEERAAELFAKGRTCSLCCNEGSLDAVEIGDRYNYLSEFLCRCEMAEYAKKIPIKRKLRVFDHHVEKNFAPKHSPQYYTTIDSNLGLVPKEPVKIKSTDINSMINQILRGKSIEDLEAEFGQKKLEALAKLRNHFQNLNQTSNGFQQPQLGKGD